MTRFILPLVLAVVLFSPIAPAHAASEAVQINLTEGSFSRNRYIVPAGKVLLIEYVNFSDYWVGGSAPLELTIVASVNPTGPVWDSTRQFYSAVNALSRVLRVPSGGAISIPYSSGGINKAFIYGVLVDASSQVISP